MQKKLLSLVMMISFSTIYCDDVNTSGLDQILTSMLCDDLEKPMGSLGECIENSNEIELRQQIHGLKGDLIVMNRLLREKDIRNFAKTNTKDFEKALVDEFSGQCDAIKKEFEKNKKNNKENEESERNKEWDGFLGYIWSSEPSDASAAGREYREIRSVKAKKDEINESNYNLVTKSKGHVIQILDSELDHQRYLLEALYLKGLRVCGGNADCLSRRKINWQDTQREGFFAEFAMEAYAVAVRAAKEEGIEVSLEDMNKIATKNPRTAQKVQRLLAVEKEANEELNKILNPQSKSNPYSEDSKEDQNDQGAFSQ